MPPLRARQRDGRASLEHVWHVLAVLPAYDGIGPHDSAPYGLLDV